MMAPTHIAATLLGAYVLSKLMPWDSRLWVLAIVFGVLIDVDHALAFPQYLLDHGVAGLNVADMLAYGHDWRGPMHGPWGVAVAVAACLLFWTPVPAVFLGLHYFLDFKVGADWVVWGSATEWMVLGALVGAMLAAGGAEAWLAEHPEGVTGYWLDRCRTWARGAAAVWVAWLHLLSR